MGNTSGKLKDPKIIAAITISTILVFIALLLGALFGSGIIQLNQSSSPTSAPSTQSPTNAPSTQAPTNAPSTQAPSTQAPSTQSPTNAPSTQSPSTFAPTSPGNQAPFSPINGNIWNENFDSMTNSNKCVFDLSNSMSISLSNCSKIQKYMIDNGLLPIDNPFENTIDIPVIGSSGRNSALTLTISTNSFNVGDQIYVYGVLGNTNANSLPIIPSTPMNFSVVTSVNASGANFILGINHISNCFSGGNFVLPCSTLLFSNGNYTGGGVIRLVQSVLDRTGGYNILYNPPNDFNSYLSTLNPPIIFNWPYMPMTASAAYTIYSNNYNNYLTYLSSNLSLSYGCTTANFNFRTDVSNYVNGSASVTGGSGTGMQLQIIKYILVGYTLLQTYVSNPGSGYVNGDTITIVQGSNNNATASIDTTNCTKQPFYNYSSDIILSSGLSPNQFNSLINYAISLDSSINTIVLQSGNSFQWPENYQKPNLFISFLTTAPTDTYHIAGSNVPSYNTDLIPAPNGFIKLCSCNGVIDSSQIFFPNKVDSCSNQIIYTTSGAFNFSIASNSCPNAKNSCP